MNNRIQELMPKPWTFPYPDREMYSKEQMQRLAEIIVQECAYKISRMVVMDKGYVPKDPHSIGWNDAVAYASRELKQYFND